jgi:hypothetical protein
MTKIIRRWAQVMSIRLDAADRALLAELCELTGGTRSFVFRIALRKYHWWLTSAPRAPGPVQQR